MVLMMNKALGTPQDLPLDLQHLHYPLQYTLYNHIYGAVTGAAAYGQKKSEEISIFQAANSVIGHIECRIERARVNKWNVKPYNRNIECPRSVISQVLFDAVLGIGDNGFNERPGLKIASTGVTSV